MDALNTQLEVLNRELAQTKAQLRQSENRLAAIYHATTGCVLLLDLDGGVIDTNACTVQATGYTRDEIVGQRMPGFLTADSQRIFAAQCVAPEETAHQPWMIEFVCRDGSIRVMKCSSSPLRDGRGTPCGLCIHALEITGRSETEPAVKSRAGELQYLNRELQTFCYSVSHDLRAPLRAIREYAKQIRSCAGEATTDETRFCLDRINHNTRRMGDMIDSLLILSRVDQAPLHGALPANGVNRARVFYNRPRRHGIRAEPVPNGAADCC